MPPREWRLRIEDILAAIERVQRHTQGLDLSSFIADEKTVDAVCFCYGVIGEAARHIWTKSSRPIPICLGQKCELCAMSWCTSTSA